MRKIVVADDSTVADVARLMDVSITEVVRRGLHGLGLLLTANDRPGFDQLSRVAEQFGFRAVSPRKE